MAQVTERTPRRRDFERVKREPSLTEKTQTWLEIRKAVPAMKRVGINPGEVKPIEILKILFLPRFKIILQVLIWSQERGLDEVEYIPCFYNLPAGLILTSPFSCQVVDRLDSINNNFNNNFILF